MRSTTLSKERRQALLNQFRSTDPDRPTLHHNMELEWLGKQWICTTNASSVILIQDERDINVDREAKTPNVRAVLPQAVTERELDVVLLLSLYDQVPVITRQAREECEACDGNGEFNYHGERYRCKSCNQKGHIELSRTETIKDPEYHLHIDGKYLVMDRWEELQELLTRIKPKQAWILENIEKPILLLVKLDDTIIVAFVKKYFNPEDKIGKFVSYENASV
jgi:hypothetical protein